MKQPAAIHFDSYEALFRFLHLETGDSFILVDSDLKIIDADEQTSELYGISREDVIGQDLRELVFSGDRHHLERALRELGDFESWAGELLGVRKSGERFPVDMTIKRIPFNMQSLFCIISRNLSEYQLLKERLRQEKANRREMYITMRNLMKAYEKEKTGVERGISHKIDTLLIPTIEKIRREQSRSFRNTFLDLLQEQLVGLTRGFATEIDGRFLRLTRAEMSICQLIQTGQASKDIAARLKLSYETVQTHRKNIRKKLGIKGRKVSLYGLLATKSFFSKNAP
ncbi:MAG: PAS and helix-turn-helix domain-containing protein [Desulfobacterales bacterium]